ncbi:MAG: hypothetical protein ABIW17_06455 [Marmoricola sp.]
MTHTLLRLYRPVWSVAAGTLCLFGTALSWWILSPSAVLMLGGVTGGAAAGTYWLLTHEREGSPVSTRWSTLLKVPLVAAGISLGLVGLGQLAGGSGAAVLAMVLLASPDLPGLVRALMHPQTTPDAQLLPRPVGSLTTEQLCRAWSASFEALNVEADPARMWVLSGLRRSYLDELQRRDPGGFDLWMALHAHPGEDPRPHLSLERGPGQTPGS